MSGAHNMKTYKPLFFLQAIYPILSPYNVIYCNLGLGLLVLLRGLTDDNVMNI